MASVKFKLLSKIDKETKNAVYGWIRKHEKLLKLGNIPTMISIICILYYRNEEEFINNGINIGYPENNHKCVMSIFNGHKDHHQAFGSTLVPSMNSNIYEWDILIKELDYHETLNNVQIGLAAFQNGKHYISALYQNKGGLNRENKLTHSGTAWKYSDEYNEGDIITVSLDFKNKELRFKRNEIDQGVAWDNIPQDDVIAYSLFITIFCGASVEILSFYHK